MIKTLYEIGKVLSEDQKFEEYYFPWENPFPRGGDAVVIVLQVVNGELLEEVQFESFTTSKVKKYLFRTASANSFNLVPTYYYQVGKNNAAQTEEIRKKIDKIKASFKNSKLTFIRPADIERISTILSKIIVDSKNSYLLTFTIDGKYFGDFPEYTELFYKDAYNKYFVESKGEDEVCAVTYQKEEEVWGRVNTLGFTVNDVAFSRNGFDVKKSYKMFPVSPDAVKILEGTYRFVNIELSKNFYGLKYFILPHFINIDSDNKKAVIEEFVQKNEQQTFMTEINSIIDKEGIISEILESENLSRNNIFYDIFFYQLNNAQIIIKLHLADVLPSRFKKILTHKEQIYSVYSAINNFTIEAKKGQAGTTIEYHIHLANIKEFFYVKKIKGDVLHNNFKILLHYY